MHCKHDMEGLNITIIMKFMSTRIMKTVRYVRKEILKSTAEQSFKEHPWIIHLLRRKTNKQKNPYITYLKF